MSAFYTPEELAANDPFKRAPIEFERYSGPALTDQMTCTAEQRLGVKLPVALLELLKESNGGILKRRALRAPDLADGEIEFTSVHGLGYDGGLDCDTGAWYMTKEWRYPKGLLWLDGDGHTGIFLDYRACGSQGEPSVVWHETESGSPDPRLLAPDFATFLSHLQRPEDF